jgi:hypothetical protein
VRTGLLAAGTKNLKDHRNLLLERRAIIARRSVQPASAPITTAVSFIYHSAQAKERGIPGPKEKVQKKIKRKEEF